MSYTKNDISNDPRVPYILGSPVRFKQTVDFGENTVEAGTIGVVTSVPGEDDARLVVKVDDPRTDFGDVMWEGDESSDVVWEGDELDLVTEDLEFDQYSVSAQGKQIIGSLMQDTLDEVTTNIPVSSEHYFGNRICVVLDDGTQVEAETVEINEFGWSVRVHVRHEDKGGRFLEGEVVEMDAKRYDCAEVLANTVVQYCP